ncbi:MAG TPA: GntR family transcriptional regulator [Acidimicrobiales bacterium]
MTAIDRSHPLPLWAQVLDDLRRRLDGGEFGERFPTDAELSSTYGVSRHTVREAVRRLTDAGLIQRERGRGTFVTAPVIEQAWGSLYSLFRSVEAQGFEQRSRVLALDETIDPSVATRLELPGDAPLVRLERIRFAGDDPLAHDVAWLPAQRARPLLGVDFTHTALYDELARICAVVLTSGTEWIRPAVATRDQRDLLGMRGGQGVFSIERLTRTDDRPVEWRHTVVRGDRYAFVSRWSRSQPFESTMEPDHPAEEVAT